LIGLPRYAVSEFVFTMSVNILGYKLGICANGFFLYYGLSAV